MKDDERSGRPTTSRTDDDIAAFDKMVKEDRNVASRLITDTLGIPKTVVLRILREDPSCTTTPWRIRQQKFDSFWLKNKSQHWNTPPYSPDSSPSDYFVFLKVKLQLKGARFDTIEEIQKAVTDQLNKIPTEDFSKAMKKLEKRANMCYI